MKKALVIVSFGTTYERARRSIDAVERALAQAAEVYDVFRAYTSSIVRKVLKSRGEIVPSLEEALEKLANESYDTVFVQPTHLLCGNEYDEKIRASYMRYAGRFLRGGIGKPLIANNDDLLKLAEILAALKPDDADALLLFDVSAGENHIQSLLLYKDICDVVNIPVYGGGHINSAEDVADLFTAGCEKVVLNFGKECHDLLRQVADAYGRNRIAVSIASADNIVINKAILEENASELVLIDEHALKNCLGASTLPCIVFLPEISLDKLLSMMEKPNVSGLSGNIVNENCKVITALKSLCRERGISVHSFEAPMAFSEFKLLSDGLIPVVVQDYQTKDVLMVAYMNEEAYLTTLRTGKMTYYSRSRKELWIKGMTSGHFQYVKALSIDCDNDTLLAKVKQIGAACHTGNYSCFYRDLIPMKL